MRKAIKFAVLPAIATALLVGAPAANAASDDSNQRPTTGSQQPTKAKVADLNLRKGILHSPEYGDSPAEIYDTVEGTSTRNGDFKQDVAEGYYVKEKKMEIKFPTLADSDDDWGTPTFEISGLSFANGKVTGGVLRQSIDPLAWDQPVLMLNDRNSKVTVTPVDQSYTTNGNVTLTVQTRAGLLELQFSAYGLYEVTG